jgi:hypothetical protein
MSFSIDSAPANQQILGGVMVNGSIQSPGQAQRTIANAADVGTFCGTAILNLSASDQISLALNNTSSAGKNATVEYLSVTIVQIGG